MQRRSGADELEDDLVRILLRLLRDVSVHLQHNENADDQLAAQLSVTTGTVADVEVLSSPSTDLTLCTRFLQQYVDLPCLGSTFVH